MTLKLNWRCDFCNHGTVMMSAAGILYCDECRMSYGKSIYDMMENKK
jgi:ribosomal protein L37AE/L43A